MIHTVVIAAYNCETWIGKTIQDVLDQTDQEFELLIVDDGSTDGTQSVIQGYAQRDSRVRYIGQKNSGSPARPRNIGLEQAQGEWISFLDHDDRWYPERLAIIRREFTEYPEISVICHSQDVLRDGQIVGKNTYGPASSDLYVDMLRRGNRLATSATAIRTSFARSLGGFDERRDFFTVEDFDLWLRSARAGGVFKFLPQSLGAYVFHEFNMTGNRERHYTAKRALAQYHLNLEPARLAQYRKEILAHCEFAVARDQQLLGKFSTAQKKYAESIALGYRSWKPYVGWVLSGLRIRR
jgi:teichuronic acid biosynthesis glycosyltransferase TuaG